MTSPESPADLLRRAAGRIRRVEAVAYDGRDAIDSIGDIDGALAEMVVTLRRVAVPLAEVLRNAAARWDEDNTFDRPESGEMEPTHPEAWWCGSCQGAIDSPDYPGDDQRCNCGRWSDMLALAGAVLGETEENR